MLKHVSLYSSSARNNLTNIIIREYCYAGEICTTKHHLKTELHHTQECDTESLNLRCLKSLVNGCIASILKNSYPFQFTFIAVVLNNRVQLFPQVQHPVRIFLYLW